MRRRPKLPGPGRLRSWLEVVRGSRSVGLLTLVAVAGLVLGSVASALALRSQEASGAADVEPGPITVPVERRVIVNEIRARGTARYDDTVDLVIDPSLLTGPATVSGRVPQPGDTVAAGSVVLEVAGRPVIALPGDVPAYRDLSIGTTGADVTALKAGLAALGIDPGDQASATFDETTAAAVAQLYALVGYEVPQREDAEESVSAAEADVRGADLAVLAARRDLDTVRAGTSAAERAELDAAVREAELALATANTEGDAAAAATAQNALTVAVARRDDAVRPRDDRVEEAALDAAVASAQGAQERLARARADAQPYLPASEVAFVPGLPRRVDVVQAVRGRPLDGVAMTVSGTTLVVVGELAPSEAALVTAGAAVTLTLPDGSTLPGTVASVGVPVEGPQTPDTQEEGGDEEAQQELANPDAVPFVVSATGDAAQLAALAGQSLRVAIPIGSTDGEVWAVPAAAVSTGADGGARVEVVPADGGDSVRVDVVLGLAADGYVEITSSEVELADGMSVVVGR